MPIEHRGVYVSTTLMIVIFTTIICGGLTEPMLSKMGMRNNHLLISPTGSQTDNESERGATEEDDEEDNEGEDIEEEELVPENKATDRLEAGILYKGEGGRGNTSSPPTSSGLKTSQMKIGSSSGSLSSQPQRKDKGPSYEVITITLSLSTTSYYPHYFSK